MVKTRVCKKCKKIITDESSKGCDNCKGNTFVNSWQGRVAIMQPKKSRIAHEMGLENPGEYAIKVR